MVQIYSPRPLPKRSHCRDRYQERRKDFATAHASLSLNNLDCSTMTGCQRNFAITGYQRGIEQFG